MTRIWILALVLEAPNKTMEYLLKTLFDFSDPRLGLVRHDTNGRTGVNGALLDSMHDDPYLALQCRRLGHRQTIPGVTDNTTSRAVLDELAQDLEFAAVQAAVLLTGEVDRLTFNHPLLPRLLPHTPALPVTSIAALETPDDLARRPFVLAWLNQEVSAGRLPTMNLRRMDLVDFRSYAELEGRPQGSRLIDAWLGETTVLRTFALFSQDEK
jgi:hypothetical protein